MEAAEAVGAGDGTEEGDVLDLLSRLVDKSMVVAEARAAGVEMLHATSLRYRMLEPARQYGLERLEESGEAEQVREQHATVRHEAEGLRREHLDRRELAYLLIFLGLAALDEGDYDVVEALYEESMALTRELGDKRGIAMCLTALIMTALEQGDPERAAALLKEDLRLLQELRDKAGTSYGLRGMAAVAALRGEPARAARLWGLRKPCGRLSVSP